MNAVRGSEGVCGVRELIEGYRGRGVRIWTENGQLRYRAPRAVLSGDEIEGLKQSKNQILAYLSDTADVLEGPLSFTQRHHWHLYKLGERRAIRQIATATRLCGRLDIDALQRSARHIVLRHTALHTQIVVVDGNPIQRVNPENAPELLLEDLSGLPAEEREAAMRRRIDSFIMEKIDLATGHLCGMTLVRLKENEHVLIVALEHSISDMSSMHVLLRELFTAYRQITTGETISLPPVAVQFIDHVRSQQELWPMWLEKHGPYWRERLTKWTRLRFPEGAPLADNPVGWGTVPVPIDKELKAGLLEWSRNRKTTLVLSIFTAYVALVMRWCDVRETTIQFQTDGRQGADVQNAIGYFACPIYIHIEMYPDDTFTDLLQRVTSEYCNAYEHADFSYFESQLPRPAFTVNSCFNWVPNGAGSVALNQGGARNGLTFSPVTFEHPMAKLLERDHEPSLLLFDTDDHVDAAINFPLSRASVQTMEQFGRSFQEILRSMVEQPQRRVMDIQLR